LGLGWPWPSRPRSWRAVAFALFRREGRWIDDKRRACVRVRALCLPHCLLPLPLPLPLPGGRRNNLRARGAGGGGWPTSGAHAAALATAASLSFRPSAPSRASAAKPPRAGDATAAMRARGPGRAGGGLRATGERGTCTRRVTRSTGSRHRAITHSTVHRARTRATAGDDARARWPADSSLVQVAVHHWLCAARHAETLPSSSSEKTTSIDRSIGLLRPSEL
jgi:hypothetical protein